MADGRMLKKKISKSRKLAALPSDSERLFYTWLIPHLDVEGRILADPDVLKGDIVPRLKEWTPERVEQCLVTLARAELILLYEAGGDQFLELVRFKDEQRLDPKREARSQCPDPPTKRKPLVKADYEYVWNKWKQEGMVCPECGRKAEFVAERGLVADGYIPFHIDHIKPLSKGGTNSRENLRVICRECNLKKGNTFNPEPLQSTPELVQSTQTQDKFKLNISKNKRTAPAAPFFSEEQLKKIDKLSKTLIGYFHITEKRIWQWIELCKKGGCRAEHIVTCLKQLWDNRKDVNDPWPWLNHIMSVMHQNANEAEGIREHEARKAEELAFNPKGIVDFLRTQANKGGSSTS